MLFLCSQCVRDHKDHLFGVFASEPWRRSTDYYGNGSTFVMKVAPKLQVFKWTFENSFFMCCKDQFLGVGGGKVPY